MTHNISYSTHLITHPSFPTRPISSPLIPSPLHPSHPLPSHPITSHAISSHPLFPRYSANCAAPMVAPEVCDGLDNNFDGEWPLLYRYLGRHGRVQSWLDGKKSLYKISTECQVRMATKQFPQHKTATQFVILQCRARKC